MQSAPVQIPFIEVFDTSYRFVSHDAIVGHFPLSPDTHKHRKNTEFRTPTNDT